jgi:hypothetical protein
MNRNHLVVFTACLLAVSVAMIVRAAEPEIKTSGPVYSMREFDLKSGVNTDEFDAFVRKEMANALGKDAEGMKLLILRGDRGVRRGHYLLVWEFDSVAARDRYFPREGSLGSPAFQQVLDRMKAVMGKFSGEINQNFAYTDYVQMSE